MTFELQDFMNAPFIKAIEECKTASAEVSGVSFDDLDATIDNVSACFVKDFDNAYTLMSFMHIYPKDVEFQTKHALNILNAWCDDEAQAPSITALLAASMVYFRFQNAERIRHVIMAGLLADVPNALPYHGNMHFLKVVFHMIRLITAHNVIFADTRSELMQKDIAKLLVAAAIHDLDHCGYGNVRDGEYQRAYTELKSFHLASNYLGQAGIDHDDLNDIRTMLITTDVSVAAANNSPADELRRAYEYHFGADEKQGDDLDLSDDINALKDNATLCLMCMLLHEADIMNSAGVSYDVTVREAQALGREIDESIASPSGVLTFFEKICKGRLLSDAANFLGAGNMGKITELVQADFVKGVRTYL